MGEDRLSLTGQGCTKLWSCHCMPGQHSKILRKKERGREKTRDRRKQERKEEREGGREWGREGKERNGKERKLITVIGPWKVLSECGLLPCWGLVVSIALPGTGVDPLAPFPALLFTQLKAGLAALSHFYDICQSRPREAGALVSLATQLSLSPHHKSYHAPPSPYPTEESR